MLYVMFTSRKCTGEKQMQETENSSALMKSEVVCYEVIPVEFQIPVKS